MEIWGNEKVEMHHCEFLEYSLGPRHEHKPKLLRLPSERFLCTIVLARYKRGKLQLIRHYSFNKLIINAKAWSEPLLQSPELSICKFILLTDSLF